MIASSQHAHSAQHALLAEDEDDDRELRYKIPFCRHPSFLGSEEMYEDEEGLLPPTELIHFNAANNGYFVSSWSVHCIVPPSVRHGFFAYSNIPTQANYIRTIKEASHHHVRAVFGSVICPVTEGAVHTHGRKIRGPLPSSQSSF